MNIGKVHARKFGMDFKEFRASFEHGKDYDDVVFDANSETMLLVYLFCDSLTFEKPPEV